jgi:hypothetical protein
VALTIVGVVRRSGNATGITTIVGIFLFAALEAALLAALLLANLAVLIVALIAAFGLLFGVAKRRIL